jgi:hypothetical protein
MGEDRKGDQGPYRTVEPEEEEVSMNKVERYKYISHKSQ